jgi:hypothetical protein
MNKSEIIKQAKHYFGKDRTFIKDLILSYEFKGKNYKRWKKEIGSIISNPNEIQFKIFDDVVLWIKDNQAEEINWNWIGDLSWTIEIVLNPDIDKCYDMDRKLALKCNGTVRLLTVYVSDVLPCYTYDLHYMTYSKVHNYYECGPIFTPTDEEKLILKKVITHLEGKGLRSYGKEFYLKKFKELYSDTNSDGNASLFDVLLVDTSSYQTEIKRISDKQIVEKSGTKFSWTEYYNKDGTLKERSESRWTSAGDYFKVILDGKEQIQQVEVTRKKIGRKKYQEFKLDIVETFNKRKREPEKRKKLL